MMIMEVLFCHLVRLFSFSYEASATAKDKQDMITELIVMKRLKPHPNVLKLVGCCSISGKSGPTITQMILVFIMIILIIIIIIIIIIIKYKFIE